MAGMTKTERKIKSIMTKRGTWQPDFTEAVKKLAGMLDEFDILYERFVQDGYEIATTDSNGREKKTLLYSTLETLRRDSLSYMNALGLTPTALKKLDAKVEDRKISPLTAALRKFDAV